MVSDSLTLAAKRVRSAIDSGERVKFISTQLATVLVILFMIALSVGAEFTDHPVALVTCQAVLFSAAIIIAIACYIRARQNRRLLALVPDFGENSLLGSLTTSERRALTRQVRGREPTTDASAPLVEAMIEFGRVRNRAAWPSLVAFFLTLLAVALRYGWPIITFVVAVALFVIVVTRIENARWRRVLQNRKSPLSADETR